MRSKVFKKANGCFLKHKREAAGRFVYSAKISHHILGDLGLLYSVIFNRHLQWILGKCSCRHLFRSREFAICQSKVCFETPQKKPFIFSHGPETCFILRLRYCKRLSTIISCSYSAVLGLKTHAEKNSVILTNDSHVRQIESVVYISQI